MQQSGQLAHPAVGTCQSSLAQSLERAAGAAWLVTVIVATRSNVTAAGVGAPPARLELELPKRCTAVAAICARGRGPGHSFSTLAEWISNLGAKQFKHQANPNDTN